MKQNADVNIKKELSNEAPGTVSDMTNGNVLRIFSHYVKVRDVFMQSHGYKRCPLTLMHLFKCVYIII